MRTALLLAAAFVAAAVTTVDAYARFSSQRPTDASATAPVVKPRPGRALHLIVVDQVKNEPRLPRSLDLTDPWTGGQIAVHASLTPDVETRDPWAGTPIAVAPYTPRPVDLSDPWAPGQRIEIKDNDPELDPLDPWARGRRTMRGPLAMREPRTPDR